MCDVSVLSLSDTVVVLYVMSVLLSLSDTVVVVLCVMSVLLSLSDAVVIVLCVMSLCCHCQTQWLLSCM